jgi:hypothetical protein
MFIISMFRYQWRIPKFKSPNLTGKFSKNCVHNIDPQVRDTRSSVQRVPGLRLPGKPQELSDSALDTERLQLCRFVHDWVRLST